MTSRRDLYALGEPFGDACTRLEGGRRVYGGGGGGSSSSSSTQTSTQNTDKRQVVDNQSVGVSSDSSTVNVSMLDGQAVDKAIDLVRDAGAASIDAYKSLLAVTLALDGKISEAQRANSDLAGQLVVAPRDTTYDAALVIGGLMVVGLLDL